MKPNPIDTKKQFFGCDNHLERNPGQNPDQPPLKRPKPIGQRTKPVALKWQKHSNYRQ
jgi:hypothetical protein